VEPWSADDPWQERRDPTPAWDAWPPQAPSADEYGHGQPDPPASDPWAESWTDDVPGIPTAPPPEYREETDRLTDADSDPSPAAVLEPEAAEQEPSPDTDADEAPRPYSENGQAPQLVADAEPSAPHIEPWSPDPDPWGAAWTMPPAVEEPAAEVEPPIAEAEPESIVEAEADLEPEPIAEAEPEPVAEAEPEAEPIAAAEPIVEAEPQPEPVPVAEAEPDIAAEPEPEPIAEPEPELEASGPEALPAAEPALAAAASASDELADADAAPDAPVREGWQELEPGPEPALWGGPVEPGGVDANGDQPAAEAPSVFDAWDADIESAPEPAALPPIWTAESEPSPEAEAAPAEPEIASPWVADPWAEPEADIGLEAATAAAAAVDAEQEEPEADAEPALDAEPEATDEGDRSVAPEIAAAAAIAASSAAVEAPEEAPSGPVWPERSDRTEVLPTTWAPRPAPTREEMGVAPLSGEIRTTLGQPDLDGDVAEEPTTAEQAVPWLIGVILLLAGMVIVLLALIFAGDGSLGGGTGASPTPVAAAFVPVGSGGSGAPNPTPRTSPTAGASASAEPSGSAEPAPQFGALEMVYQGRATALEPIWLLRRDFAIDVEPDVLAQDPSLNVQRFAWSPNGATGAVLYADLLVGIDPGADRKSLSDGISAITFGDAAGTVYAVRIRAEGDVDVASILAVKQAGGEERELDRVRYQRPPLEEEAALAEAQYLDEGGAIRLYWMHDDTLRLWIHGAGAWTIDPAEGSATKLEEDGVPVLWAPEGERRIRLSVDGNRTTLHMVDRSDDEKSRASVAGRVSHLRWSPSGMQVVFTVGRATSGGGVRQDLYLWNLGEGDDPEPTMMTSTGAAFGAEWLGSQPRWEED
jgi:hypothetical protein